MSCTSVARECSRCRRGSPSRRSGPGGSLDVRSRTNDDVSGATAFQWDTWPLGIVLKDVIDAVAPSHLDLVPRRDLDLPSVLSFSACPCPSSSPCCSSCSSCPGCLRCSPSSSWLFAPMAFGPAAHQLGRLRTRRPSLTPSPGRGPARRASPRRLWGAPPRPALPAPRCASSCSCSCPSCSARCLPCSSSSSGPSFFFVPVVHFAPVTFRLGAHHPGAQRAERARQIPHVGLAGVAADNRVERLAADADPAGHRSVARQPAAATGVRSR